MTQVVGDDGVVHGGKFPLAVGEGRDEVAVDVEKKHVETTRQVSRELEAALRQHRTQEGEI